MLRALSLRFHQVERQRLLIVLCCQVEKGSNKNQSFDTAQS